MKFLRSILTNDPLVNILFSVVLIMGILAYGTMPRAREPEINFNFVVVNTILPGASAEDVEELLTGPLEDAISQVQDIRFVQSSSRDSVSDITIRFNELSQRQFDKRINDLRREIQNKANAELPPDIEDPLILEITSSNGFPTAIVVLTGQADDEVLRFQARQVTQDLEQIKGVDQIRPVGFNKPELQIRINPAALAGYQLSAADVADQLRNAYRNISAGEIDLGDEGWTVRIEGRETDPDELAKFVVSSPQVPAQKVTLGSIATIERGHQKPSQLVSSGGYPAVSLAVTKVSGANTLQLLERINNYIAAKNPSLDQMGLSLIIADDQTTVTRSAINVMERNALLGLILVLGVCSVFLGIRIASMVTLGIAFSVSGTMWLLDATGNTLNISVLLGIVIVLGMLVDDAVVVVESIYYRLQRGEEALEAAISALKEVVKPVTSAVFTTIAAFLPLMLLPGIVGDFMFIIPFVVTVGLLVSLVEAYWILPAHVIVLMPRGRKRKEAEWRIRWTRHVRSRYAKALAYVLRRPRRFVGGGVAAFVLALSAVFAGAVKVDFFTFDPFPLFYINVDMPPTVTLDETLNQAARIEDELRKKIDLDDVRSITSVAGLKFADDDQLISDRYGQIAVSLTQRGRNDKTVTEIVDELRDYILAIPTDAEITFYIPSGGPPVAPPISVNVRSSDFEELRAATQKLKEIISAIPGTRDISDNDAPGRPELTINLDYQAVRDAGLDPGYLARLLRLHLDGEVIAFTRDRGEKLELRVRGPERNTTSIQAVLDDPIILPGGGRTTFRALTNTEYTTASGLIRHFNYRRSITVESELDDETTNTLAANKMLEEEWGKIQREFPNTDLDYSGAFDDVQESLDAMWGLFLLGLGIIYLILATQFRSYFQPLLILVTVPMAFTGVVAGLFITGNPLSLYTLYGVIALTGIAVNSAIVLIDAANARIAAGMRPLHATVYAGRRRVIPILMTSLTTIAGLFSLAFGLGGKSLLWGPVAMSIVAGLVVATVLTLFIVPVLYRLFMMGHTPSERQIARSTQS